MKRWSWTLVCLVALITAGIAFATVGRSQDDPSATPEGDPCPTPVAASASPPVNATPDPLGYVEPTGINPCSLALVRWTLDPGGSFPVFPYPTAIIYVESGSLQIELTAGLVVVWTGHSDFFRQPYNPGDTIPVVQANDSFSTKDATYGLTNAGTEPVELWVAVVKEFESPCSGSCWQWP